MAHSSHWRSRRFGQASRGPRNPPPHAAPRDDPPPLNVGRPETPSSGEGGNATDASYPQPLQGFDYSFGAVG